MKEPRIDTEMTINCLMAVARFHMTGPELRLTPPSASSQHWHARVVEPSTNHGWERSRPTINEAVYALLDELINRVFSTVELTTRKVPTVQPTDLLTEALGLINQLSGEADEDSRDGRRFAELETLVRRLAEPR